MIFTNNNDQSTMHSLNIALDTMINLNRFACLSKSIQQRHIQIPIEKNGLLNPLLEPRGFLHRGL